jgi:hypothetical protein
VVERLAEPDGQGRRSASPSILQLDFALNQPLSPFALAAIELLDRDAPSYALDVVSVIESTLDNPRPVLSAQQFRARGEAVAQMKADGIEYEQRLDLLEEVTHPRPLVELLDAAYEMYRRGHPWVADHELAPKSVVRDMYERGMTFVEYISFYSLSRSEGLVLRYLADAYRALRQSVPEEAKTEELADLIEWLGELVRQVDSSLLDEWERLRNPTDEPVAQQRPGRRDDQRAGVPGAGPQRDVPAGEPRRAAPLRRAGRARRGAPAGTPTPWAAALDEYFESYLDIRHRSGRRVARTSCTSRPGRPRGAVRQVFDDPDGDHDWGSARRSTSPPPNEQGVAAVRHHLGRAGLGVELAEL